MELLVKNIIQTFYEFSILTLKVLPYFLAGTFAGALIQTYSSKEWIKKLFSGEDFISILKSVLAAIILPGCACATVPMAMGLKKDASLKLGAVAAFLFSSPLLSPITFFLTLSMLGWPMTIARTIVSFLGGIFLGLIVNIFSPWLSVKPPPQDSAPASSACSSDNESCNSSSFLENLKSVLFSITPYFLLGMFIAALMSILLPEDAISQFLGNSSGPLAYGLSVIVGIPIYICEGEEIPITYALLKHGLGVGPAFTFLMGSVGTCIPTILMSIKVIGSKATAFYVVYWFIFAITAGWLFSLM